MQSDVRPDELVIDTHRKRRPRACGPRARPTENIALATLNDHSANSKDTIENKLHGEYSLVIPLLPHYHKKWQRKVFTGEILCFPEETGARPDCHTFLALGDELDGGC